MTVCSYCGERIIWVSLESGESLPLNREPDSVGRYELLELGGDGVLPLVRRVEASQVLEAPALRFTSHLATCPDAPRWGEKHG